MPTATPGTAWPARSAEARRVPGDHPEHDRRERQRRVEVVAEALLLGGAGHQADQCAEREDGQKLGMADVASQRDEREQGEYGEQGPGARHQQLPERNVEEPRRRGRQESDEPEISGAHTVIAIP